MQIGALSGGYAGEIPNLSAMIGKNLSLRGIAAGSRRMLGELVRAAQAANLTPPIDKVFPFDQAAEAYAHLASGAHLGKVMIRI